MALPLVLPLVVRMVIPKVVPMVIRAAVPEREWYPPGGWVPGVAAEAIFLQWWSACQFSASPS